jgi:hypothetical protein
MVNTLRTPARMKAFAAAFSGAENDATFRKMFGKGFGLDAGGGKFRAIDDVILASIMAAGNDTSKFKKMWANVQGARPVEGLRQRYLEAGGGEAGAKAVRAEFKKYGGSISEKELADSHAVSMDSIESKANEFQENLDKIVSVTATKFIPAMEQLAPKFLDLARVAGSVTTWLVENPKTAIGAAVAYSIGRAGLESVVREGIERIFRGQGGPGGGPLGGPMGTGGKVATGALAALGLGFLGNQAGEYLDKNGPQIAKNKTGLWSDLGTGAGIGAGIGSVIPVVGTGIGALLGGGAGALWNVFKDGGGVDDLKKQMDYFRGGGEVAHASTPEEYDRIQAEYRKSMGVAGAGGAAGPLKVDAQIDSAQFEKSMVAALRTGVIRVEVVNVVKTTDKGGPTVDPKGRDAK